MTPSDSPNVQEAKQILGGTHATLDRMQDLAKALQAERAFTFARRILERALTDESLKRNLPRKTYLTQQYAICTYKDQDLPAHRRLNEAERILDGIENFGATAEERVETVGLYGAIHKRKWEVDGQKLSLERSLLYYRRGYEEGVVFKQGYAAINAAYLLDLIAHLEEVEGTHDVRVASGPGTARRDAATLRREEAASIRRDIVAHIPPLVQDPPGQWDWWPIVTVAEAYFGLRDYEGAMTWLMKGADLHERLKKKGGGIPDWEWESTLRQLASLARLQAGASVHDVDATARTILGAFIERRLGKGANANAALGSAFVGKFGLGLSGGGFRASLFHIGVLAKLAELDLLRRVEVLSCVSGGSIIGAHYYLEVRRLLQSKADADITREDYVDIVQRIERDFLAGVQRNIRTRILAEWWTNIKLVFSRTYTRTNRAGELYDRELFAHVPGDAPAPGGKAPSTRHLDELYVTPCGEDKSFHPKYDNFRRAAKVPILVLNATTLNTGHNWQFTASWMGEPPALQDTEIDASDRLRRMYYRQAPERHQKIRLGDAVAASACVPGIFEPLIMEGLFPDRTLRLVDGGVQDNQGIAALLDQDCNVLLVSDASGQMASVRDVKGSFATGILGNTLGGILTVLLRTKDVLMARVREAQYLDLDARRRSSLLRGLMFVHLTKDLGVPPVDWIRSDDPSPAPSTNPRTGYGVLKEVQGLLAGIRTDLDSFTDTEAYALMTSGYRMTGADLEVTKVIDGVPEFVAVPAPKPNWRFLAIEARMQASSSDAKSPYQTLLRQLRVAGSIAFKAWRLRIGLQVFAALLALVVLGVVSFGMWTVLTTPVVRDRPLATFGQIVKGFLEILLTLLATLVLGKTVMLAVRYKKTLRRALIHVGMVIFGFLIARIHLHVFDRVYLRLGRVVHTPRIVLCHAHDDGVLAARLDEALREHGLTSGIDGRDTLAPTGRGREVRTLIATSKAFVFVAGPRSIKSTICRALLTEAGKTTTKIFYVLPAGLSEADLPDRRPEGAVIRVAVSTTGTLDPDWKKHFVSQLAEVAA